MLLEGPYAIVYLMAIAVFDLSVTVCEVLTVEIYMTTLTLTFRMDQNQMYICQSKGHVRRFVFAIAMFVLSVTVAK